MKKSLLALAVLGAFAGSAFAQASSVTIFGKIDQGIGKPIGSPDKQVMEGANGNGTAGGSRIAFRGYEDLGAGLGAVFAIEHRFSADTGDAAGGATFWNGFSYVGLRSASLGTLTVGRHYTAAFLGVQAVIDPFAGETVAALRNIGSGLAIALAKARTPNSLKYDISMSGVSFSTSIGEAPTGSPDRPMAFALTYAAGPLFVGAAYENPEGANDKLLNLGARFKTGPVLVSGMYTDGTTNTNAKFKGYLVGATVTVGSGDVKAGFASSKVGTVTTSSKMGLGYHHNLSKRTKLYADFARDSKVTTPVGNVQKTGYDVGIQHAF